MLVAGDMHRARAELAEHGLSQAPISLRKSDVSLRALLRTQRLVVRYLHQHRLPWVTVGLASSHVHVRMLRANAHQMAALRNLDLPAPVTVESVKHPFTLVPGEPLHRDGR